MMIVGDNERIVNVIALLIVLVLGLMVRKTFIWYESREWTYFWSLWIAELQKDGFAALAGDFYDYSPMYLYFLFIAAQFGKKSIVAMKLITIGFDLILALFCGLMAYRMKEKSERYFVLVFSAIWLLPTVMSNSSMWAQVDAIYTSFIIMSFFFLMLEKDTPAMIMFSIAFAFKMQTMMCFPVYILLWLFKKIRTRNFLWIPVVYALSNVPAWLAGRPLGELLGIYFNQAADHGERLTLKYPNIYYLLGEFNLIGYYEKTGMYFAVGALLLFMLCVIYKLQKMPLTFEYAYLVLYASGLLVLFFLPHMHERYGYPFEALAVIYGITHRDKIWLPVLHVAITFMTYSYYYNFEAEKTIPYVILSIAMFFMVFYVVRMVLNFDTDGGKEMENKTAGKIA